MKKRLLSLCLLGMLSAGAMAQRATDVLDRGLVAMRTQGGVFCSWRMTGDEYFDVKYNIYRDGTKLNETPLNVSNFFDADGGRDSRYSVEAVVRGVPQAHSPEVETWTNNYLEVEMDHGDLKSTYIPNDACCADVDGDGELEILLKFDNSNDAAQGYLPGGYQGEYAIIEVYKLDGTKLWWIDLGPNMADFQNNENNIIAYDWDRDGKAEAVLRASDGTVIHTATGKTIEIGDMKANYRPAGPNTGANFFVHDGQEFLLYLNGETGEVYQNIPYPLKRLEDGETDLNKAWGDGYGHRSTKHFFGAPVLDGRNASIFLARGIYTRHKMIAYDVDPATHKLTERWRWNCNEPGSKWYGQGYHNFGIADVDWDGRDEIVFGSMVIDDNGKGLSTTGLGHGDAQHCSDFDPYTFGQEIFACNESAPNNNFRDATTSKIYYRSVGDNDDGRANMGKFVRDIPGAVGVSAKDPNLIGAAAHGAVKGHSKADYNITQNFRIYWDGDLCEESFDYLNGKNTEGRILKAEKGQIAVLTGSMTNNDTKGTPCYQGDIFGDWREEVIMRTAKNNIRIYTTNMETPWRNYTLWHDFQYRQAMVWQMCGYNQPPHASYFLGEMEGITMAPPALTMTGRTEIANGGTIGSSYNDKHIIMCETGDMSVSVSDGASPYILTDNAPIWTQGHDDNDNITTETYTHTLTGGAFTGAMRLVKQGAGVLVLPDVVQTYTGATDVWGGTLRFDGTLQNSRLWLNRHTALESAGKFLKGIQADYNATVIPGGRDAKGTIETDSLILNFGSRLLLDLYSDGLSSDAVKGNVLKIGTVDWQNGPQYSTPVLELVCHPADGEEHIAEGKYLIGEFDKIEGNINDIVIEGDVSGLAAGEQDGLQAILAYEDGRLYLVVRHFAPGTVTTNVDIDFSNPITDGKVFGASGEMNIQQNSSCPTEIDADGRLVLGRGEHTVIMPEAGRAGHRDLVTVSFDLAFGKLKNRNVYFNLKDEEGNSIASFDFDPYWAELMTDLGVETGDMYYDNNTVLWERKTHFTIVLDYANKVITTTTECDFWGNGQQITTNTHKVRMMNTNPLATFSVGSTYDNADRRCQFDNLLITTDRGADAPYVQTVAITGAKGLATLTPAVDLDFTYAKSIAAYTATVTGTTVNLTRTNTVAAGEGVLIRSLDGGPATEDIAVAVSDVTPTEGNMFVGVLETIEQLPDEQYGYTNFILNSNGVNGSGFYLANNKMVAAGKAYLRVPTESAGKLTFFSLDGSATAIEDVEAETRQADEGEKVYYNLRGQRVTTPTKGIYILNGKKVVVK